jgi:hypothetical protein
LFAYTTNATIPASVDRIEVKYREIGGLNCEKSLQQLSPTIKNCNTLP